MVALVLLSLSVVDGGHAGIGSGDMSVGSPAIECCKI